MRCRALLLGLLLALPGCLEADRSTGQIAGCPSRECLPEDTSHNPRGTLCYTNTGSQQAFASCKDPSKPVCELCTTAPPCESWCEANSAVSLPLGSSCHLDRECGGDPFAACNEGYCRRVLWAGQRCVKDQYTVCLYGGGQCANGTCLGLGTNQPCWAGYQQGPDLDCIVGWYCLRAVCVPQLPAGHTCYGEHLNECIRGYLCNLAGARPQCTEQYSLADGVAASSPLLCASSHVDPRSGECGPAPSFDSSGGDCSSSSECTLTDGSVASCTCKRWWDGSGQAGYCEMMVPDKQRPSFMQFFRLRRTKCHHNWPEDRCALEMGQPDLLQRLLAERQATADPTLPVPECGRVLLGVLLGGAAGLRARRCAALALAAALAAARRAPGG